MSLMLTLLTIVFKSLTTIMDSPQASLPVMNTSLEKCPQEVSHFLVLPR